VRLALTCGNAFGYPFLKSNDPKGGQVQVDPVYWEEPGIYPDYANPFLLEEDYFHGMSFWGYLPGAVYGATARKNEPCSVWTGASHYVTTLKDVYCTTSATTGTKPPWVCMTQCRL
jgi:hypothetical protein